MNYLLIPMFFAVVILCFIIIYGIRAIFKEKDKDLKYDIYVWIVNSMLYCVSGVLLYALTLFFLNYIK